MPKYKTPNNEKAKGEASDILDAIGSDSEAEGRKWARYFIDLWEKKQWEKNQLREQDLSKKRRKKADYFRLCADMLHDQAVRLERAGPGYWIEVSANEKGVLLKLHDRFKRTFARGFTPSGIPKYDVAAVNNFLGTLQDTMWDLEEDKRTDKGVFLP